MKAFDVHAHLYDEKFTDIDNVIKNAKKILNGVLVAGEHPESNRQVLALAKKYPQFCYASLGFHPTRIPDFSDKEIEDELKFIEKNSDKLIAISETGLDYMWLKRELPKDRYEKEKVRQIKYFRNYILLAKKLSLPLVVHSRWSMKDVVKAIELKHLVLETDSPVLAPVRGERNEPANVKFTIKKIAKLKNIKEEKVIQETNKNIKELFGL